MTHDIDALVKRLRAPAMKFGLEEHDPTYDLRQEAATALQSEHEARVKAEGELVAVSKISLGHFSTTTQRAQDVTRLETQLASAREALEKIASLREFGFCGNSVEAEMKITAEEALRSLPADAREVGVTPAARAIGDPICRKCATQEQGSPPLPAGCSCGDFAAGPAEVEYTSRGFAVVRFSDLNGVSCTVQASSLATEDAIWLGAQEIGLSRFTPGQGWCDVPTPSDFGGVTHTANNRMHLSREQVAALLPVLQRFVETACLTAQEKTDG